MLGPPGRGRARRRPAADQVGGEQPPDVLVVRRVAGVVDAGDRGRRLLTGLRGDGQVGVQSGALRLLVTAAPSGRRLGAPRPHVQVVAVRAAGHDVGDALHPAAPGARRKLGETDGPLSQVLSTTFLATARPERAVGWLAWPTVGLALGLGLAVGVALAVQIVAHGSPPQHAVRLAGISMVTFDGVARMPELDWSVGHPSLRSVFQRSDTALPRSLRSTELNSSRSSSNDHGTVIIWGRQGTGAMSLAQVMSYAYDMPTMTRTADWRAPCGCR